MRSGNADLDSKYNFFNKLFHSFLLGGSNVKHIFKLIINIFHVELSCQFSHHKLAKLCEKKSEESVRKNLTLSNDFFSHFCMKIVVKNISLILTRPSHEKSQRKV